MPDETPKQASAPDRNDDAAAFGRRLRRSREAKDMTLAELADASKVSRAMLSKIERGEASPTISVAKRIALALDVSLSFLAGAGEPQRTVVTTRKNERPVFRDPTTGFERHSLSPPSEETGNELVLHILPPGAGTGMLPAPPQGTEKHVTVTTGTISVEIDGRTVLLGEGDALYFKAEVPHAFTNAGANRAEYLVFITTRTG